MTLAAGSIAVAVAAGLVTTLIAARALRWRRSVAALGAAVARGLAVALAAIAAFGPISRTVERSAGETLVAAPRDVPSPQADLTIRWPDDAPDAASALETLRAARSAAMPASLLLATGPDIGGGRDIAPVVRALRKSGDVDAAVLPLPAADVRAIPGPSPRIVAPAGATEGVPTVLTLDAGATPFPADVARVEIDGRTVEVAVAEGATRTVTPPLDLVAGTHVVVVHVEGRLPGVAVVSVAGPPRVLVVRAGPRPSDVASMLRTQGLDVVEVEAGDLRTEDVERCAAIVLGPGVAGASLSTAIAPRVRGGAGLLVLGGEGTRGLSRFRGTALEAVLPVVAPPPPEPPPAPPAPPPPEKKPDPEKPKPALDEGEKEAMRVALLLVIDVSGSMSTGGKLQMAQQSAMAAASALAPEDRVSVIAFADDAREVAPFQDATDMKGLARRIGALRAEGQTNFFPALKAGYRRILEQPCGIRHVILLTDGETRPAVFRDLVESGAAAGVTLSTVAVGDDAETNLLANLATWGHGKLYVANDFARLPEIVTLDTRRFATGERDKRRERPKAEVEDLPEPPSQETKETPESPTPSEPPKPAASRRPHVVSPAGFLAGLDSNEWPGFPFAESAPARPASQVVLAWEDGSPALTIGRAGLGRVAVVSAGADSPEAREFHAWPAATQFLAQTVRGLVEPPDLEAPSVNVAFVDAADGRAFATVALAGGGVLSLDPLRAGGPVVARCADRGTSSIAELGAMPSLGAYVGTFAGADRTIRRAVVVSPGRRGPDAELPKRVAEAAGVRVVDRLTEPRDGPPREREAPRDLAFLLGAAVLLVAEAMLRRVARGAA